MSNETPNEEKYFVSLTFSSKDYPNRGVELEYKFSHDMTDRVLEGGHVPACYAAAQSVATVLQMMQTEESFNYTDEELALMTPEQQEEAIRDAAAAAIHTVTVPRIS